MIALLILAGVAILIAIGFLNNAVETAKVERVRLKIELADRLRRCGQISEAFPGQFMSADLKLLLTRLELNIVQRSLALDKKNDVLLERLEELEAEIAKGPDITITNASPPIMTEAQAKEVNYHLEGLHHQVIRATQEGYLQQTESRFWVNQIRHVLVLLHIEFFNNLGQQAFQDDQPGQARLAFERGVQYLKKQPDPTVYSEQLDYMNKLLKRANSMVLTNTRIHADDASELTSGLNELNAAEEEGMKKVIYD
jgi:hypothetical protein